MSAPAPHWHEHNPWKDQIVYVPIDELINCIQVVGTRIFYETLPGQLDAYILPNPHGHSIGIRYGSEGYEYYSPLGNQVKVQALLEKYQ